MNRFTSFIVGTLCLFAHYASADAPQGEEAVKEEMINHLTGIQNLFQTMYAPAEWKRTYAGWDLNEAIQRSVEKINAHTGITLKDYHEILVELFSSPQDYHVGIYFYSTEFAQLPFRVRGADGRYFVVWVDPEVEAEFPLRKGDEVVAFDGKPVHEAIDNLIMLGRRDLINDTDIELASMFLTIRAGSMGHRVPQGSVDVTVKAASESDPSTHSLTWNYRKELINPLPNDSAVKRKLVKKEIPKNIYQAIERFGIHANMTAPLAKALAKTPAAAADGSFPLGDRKGDLPPLGKVLWKFGDDKLFDAYIFESNDGKAVGYIRIAHFHGDECADDNDKDLAELRLLVRQFQRRTEKLVIDLRDNTGGYLHILLAYLNVLTDRPLPLFKQRVCLTQEDIAQSLWVINEIDVMLGQDITVEVATMLLQIRNYFSFIYQEWNEGRSFSNPVYLYGADQVIPDPVAAYGKPILVLVNGLDFSCADIFPAVLQDSGRATIFGTTTAGAGGSVRSHEYPNRMGISEYTYTATLLERQDKRVLENLGVTPDIVYRVTAEDLQDGYKGYIEAVNKALQRL